MFTSLTREVWIGQVVKKLDTGDWVHMFPEGTRSRNGDLGRMRLGVAKYCSCLAV